MTYPTKLKPNTFIRVDEKDYGYIGEAISFPTPSNTIMVRRVPGIEVSMEEMPLGKVAIAHQNYKYVHFAAVWSRGKSYFPVDMLRYNYAGPLNFTVEILEDYPYIRTALRTDASVQLFEGDDRLIITTVSDRKLSPDIVWRAERWNSFGWEIEHIISRRIREN